MVGPHFLGLAHKHSVVSPGGKRQVEADHGVQFVRPGACCVDDHRAREYAPAGFHTDNFTAFYLNPCHFTILYDACSLGAGGSHESSGGAGWISVTGFGLVGGYIEIVGEKIWSQPLDVICRNQEGGDADILVHGGVLTQCFFVLARYDLDEAGTSKARFTADAFSPVPEIPERYPGQFRILAYVVVHADQAAGTTGRTCAGEVFFQHDGFDPTLRQVIGQAGSVDSGTDNDDICCVGHARTPLSF